MTFEELTSLWGGECEIVRTFGNFRSESECENHLKLRNL